jgi:ubiquinone/menaquinone biosynthesis C-methylase UbiE
MHFFKMEGAWNGWMGWLYDAIVAAGSGDLYDAVVDALLADLPAGSRVLDLGCGSGQITVRAARRNPKAFVLGLDLSPGQVARANRRSSAVPNAGFGVADALWLPLPSGRFDRVVSAAMIKHLPDKRQGLMEMRRVCREGGSVFVMEVDRRVGGEDARCFVRRWKWVFPGTRGPLSWYFRRFVAGQGVTAGELADLLRDAGLSSVSVRKVPGQPFVVGAGTR